MLSIFQSWLWADMTLTPTHCAYTAAFFIVMFCGLVVRRIPQSWLSRAVSASIIALLMVVAGACEIYSFINSDFSFTWMFKSPGNMFFGLCVSIAVIYLIVTQYMAVSDTLTRLSDEGGFQTNYKIGLGSVILAIIAGVAAGYFIGAKGVIYVAAAFLLYQLYIALTPVFSAVKSGGNIVLSILAFIVYVAGFGGLIFLCLHFWFQAIIGAFIIIGQGAPNYCESCATYRDGYCYYKKISVDPDTRSCKKYR